MRRNRSADRTTHRHTHTHTDTVPHGGLQRVGGGGAELLLQVVRREHAQEGLRARPLAPHEEEAHVGGGRHAVQVFRFAAAERGRRAGEHDAVDVPQGDVVRADATLGRALPRRALARVGQADASVAREAEEGVQVEEEGRSLALREILEMNLN